MNFYVTPIDYPSESKGKRLGPFTGIQLTYSWLRETVYGDTLFTFSDGKWNSTDLPSLAWSDILIEAR